MNNDIRKLQILNDLIAQTWDVVNQRGMAFGGGLSHTPGVDPRMGFAVLGGGFATPGADPRMGIGHTPFDPRFSGNWNNSGWGYGAQNAYGVDPRLGPSAAFATPGVSGIGHTPFDPRLGGAWNNGWGYGAQGAFGFDPRFATPPFAFNGGLSHTGYDPRWSVAGYGVPLSPAYGTPGMGIGGVGGFGGFSGYGAYGNPLVW